MPTPTVEGRWKGVRSAADLQQCPLGEDLGHGAAILLAHRPVAEDAAAIRGLVACRLGGRLVHGLATYGVLHSGIPEGGFPHPTEADTHVGAGASSGGGLMKSKVSGDGAKESSE